jgi:predicted HTH transcriptional regulator
MTNREFLTAVAQNETLSVEIREHANAMLVKADEKNAKRRETPNKTQLANEPIKAQILELLADKSMVASDIARELEITTQKASALARQLVESGQLSVADVKVKGKGSVKCYSLAKGE